MAKIIAIWGNPGSGKSLLACILAKALTYSSEKACIISGDSRTPMLPVWAPDQITNTSHSIGQVLSSLNITNELVSTKMTIHKKYPYIGLLGFAAGENPLSYRDIARGKIDALLRFASRQVDYLILDCTSDIGDPFTVVALHRADVSVCCLTPDLRGLSYIKAHKIILENAGIKMDQHLFLAAQIRPFNAKEEVGRYIGRWDGMLPYTKEVDRCASKGDMFAAAACCHKKYADSVDRILDACDAFDDGIEDYSIEGTGINLLPLAKNQIAEYVEDEGGQQIDE